ncbi:MAG: VOC family protein [Alphaproteobacteria bacterium]
MTRFCRGPVPSLRVRDTAATIAFYRDLLGFRVTGRHPVEAPTWIELTHGPVTLQFFSDPPIGIAEPEMAGTLYLHPDDVTALAARLEGLVPFEWGPEVMSYGMREFAVRDPDGYRIAFIEPAGPGT